MNTPVKLTLGALLLLAVAAAGYWFGMQDRNEQREARNEAKAERKVLYYRNPMGLPDTSPVPKKDVMGMDYVPVYEGDSDSASQLSISPDKVQKLGVKSEAATLRALDRTISLAGRIEMDERRTFTITPKFEGWVERLYVNSTGQAVRKGQPLFDVYSPELVSAQREHALAMQGLAALQDADEDAKQSMQRLADASAARLKNWDMADAQGNHGEPRITFRAPATGIVLEKKAVQGMRFMPGEMLYQIADLSSVWVIAEVPELDIGQIKPGSTAKIKVDAYPERMFDGKVDFIYPTLNSATRTAQVRIQIANPKALLKPAMFANAQIAVGKSDKVLAVPTSAVIDSGTRRIVLIRLAEGRFEPRTITLGSRSEDYVELLSGVTEGEQVVTSANFLLDSESNLKAALGGMGEHATTAVIQPEPATAAEDHRAHGTELQIKPKARTVGHRAKGVFEAVNPDGTVSITHEPITSLSWPGMTMDFALANAALAEGIQPGSSVSFELVERSPGEWLITKLQAQRQHEGH